MQVLKSGKTIMGAKLTNAENKALDIEIQKRMSHYMDETSDEVDAIVLWILYRKEGYTESELEDFYRTFSGFYDNLSSHYEMGMKDQAWLASRALKEAGIDVAKWKR